MSQVEHADGGHKPHEIKIFIDGKEFIAPNEFMNGAQLKALAGIQSDYQLFLEKKDGDDQPIPDAYSLKLHNGMEFYSIPPATFGK